MLLVTVLTGPSGAATTVPASQSVASADGRVRLHAVVLVDESSSLAPGDVAEEAAAAGLIANNGQLDPTSQVAVIGFGSDDGQPDQDAAIDRCPLAPVGSADFRSCLSSLHVRTKAEGNSTDHAEALNEALSILTRAAKPGYFNVIFLLTDGSLHVDDSVRYGTDEGDATVTASRRNNAAKSLVTGTISSRLKAAGVQVWPLGFGAGIDVPWMQTLAKIGVTENPECPEIDSTVPEYRFAGTATAIGPTVSRALANAICGAFVGPSSGTGGPGSPVTLELEIPVVASTGTISVQKRDPGIRVRYLDPENEVVPTADGKFKGSTFKLNDSSPTTESLWIADPLPGVWKIEFTWPPGTSSQLVDANLIWQGRLNAAIWLDPSAPTPGQPVGVHVRLLTSRDQPITDPAMLAGMTFDAALAGDGFQPVPVTLVDDGTGTDSKTGDGTYSGQVVVPSTASGGLRLTGRVRAEGLRGTVQSASYSIAGTRSGGVVIRAQADESVRRGEGFTGSVSVDNPGDAPREIELVLEGLPGVSVSPATISVPAKVNGVSRKLEFAVAADAAYGERTGVLRAVDTAGQGAAGQGVVLDEEPLAFTVVPPPGWVERYWPWMALGLGVLLLGGLVAWLLRRRWRRQVDVSHLQAVVSRGSGGVTADLAAPRWWSPVFRFALTESNRAIALTPANPGDNANVYTVQRAKRGQLIVTSPRGDARTDPANTLMVVEAGLELRIVDRRVSGSGPFPPPIPPHPNDPWSGGGPADPSGSSGNGGKSGWGGDSGWGGAGWGADDGAAVGAGGFGAGGAAGAGQRVDDGPHGHSISEAPTLNPAQQNPTQPGPPTPPSAGGGWGADDWDSTASW